MDIRTYKNEFLRRYELFLNNRITLIRKSIVHVQDSENNIWSVNYIEDFAESIPTSLTATENVNSDLSAGLH